MSQATATATAAAPNKEPQPGLVKVRVLHRLCLGIQRDERGVGTGITWMAGAWR
jgi:hypothetical protein